MKTNDLRNVWKAAKGKANVLISFFVAFPVALGVGLLRNNDFLTYLYTKLR